MFKKGDKVRCVDAGVALRLTIGKVYTVITEGSYPNSVVVLDDNGCRELHYNSRFEPVNEANTFEFQVGDIVEFGGLEGKVDTESKFVDFPIRVTFEKGSRLSFTTDGRYSVYHTKPLLNLVSRPKKKEKRIVKTTVQYSPSLNIVFTGFEGLKPADCIIVELEKEIEVEV